MKFLTVAFAVLALSACTVTLPAGTTTTPPPATTPPATTPAFTESPNGAIVLGPAGSNGALSGVLTDANGTTFQMAYSSVAEFPYVYVDGIQAGAANGLRYYYAPNGGPHEVFATNSVEGVFLWTQGSFVLQPAGLPADIVNGPVIGPPAAAPVSSGGTTTTTPPASVNVTALTPLLVGSTVTLPAGTFGSADVPASVTLLQGAGEGQTIIDGTNGIAAGKACLDLQGASGTPSITIKGMTIQHCNGQSVGCVREDGGRSFVIDTVECKNSASGIGPTVDGDNVTIMNSSIHDNGQCLSEGSMHDIYIGVAPVFTLTNTTIKDTFNTGCNIVKSRALLSVLQGDTLTLNGQGHVDFPNGHTVSISATTITLPSGASDTQMLSYCAETADVTTTDQLVTLQGVKFINQNGSALVYEPNPGLCPSGVLDMSSNDNTWSGLNAPSISGFSSVKGALTQAQ